MFKNNLINRKESNISCSCASSGWKGRSLLFAAIISWWLRHIQVFCIHEIHKKWTVPKITSSYQCSTAILVHSVHYLVYVRIISYNCISRSRYCLLIQPTEILYIHTEQNIVPFYHKQLACIMKHLCILKAISIISYPSSLTIKFILSWCLPIG